MVPIFSICVTTTVFGFGEFIGLGEAMGVTEIDGVGVGVAFGLADTSIVRVVESTV
jgi:hypothetical protein